MIKISRLDEIELLNNKPKEVVSKVIEITNILNEHYGEDRDENIYGGYTLIIEDKEDFAKLNEIYLDIDDIIPEYVDIVRCSNSIDWLHCLILSNNDYSTSLLMPMSIAPKNILAEIERIL